MIQLGGSNDGLYLCGASTVSHGVAGVIQSGLAVASRLLHGRKDELLKQKGPEVEINYYSATHFL